MRHRWLLGWALLLGAETLVAGSSGPGATSAVLDETRALSDDSLAELQRELSAFESDTGVKLFVKAVPFLDPGSNLRSTARLDRRTLCPTGPVALILLERGNGGLGLSHSPELWQRYPMAQTVETLRAALSASADANLSLEQRALVTARVWMEGIRQLEATRRAHERVLPAGERPLQAAFVATLALGTLGCMMLGHRARASFVKRGEQFHFPEVTVAQRLGAPYGGGVIVSVSSPPSKSA